MKRLILALLTAAVGASAGLSISFYRYANWGPQRVFAGRSYLYHIGYMWGFDATCDAATNTCFSPDYTPDATVGLWPDPDQTPPGGIQNQPLQWRKPQYQAVNIGTNGNAAGHWNLQTCAALSAGVCSNRNGAAISQVTITSTAAIHFYIGSGGPATTFNAYLHHPVNWPAGTKFTYYQASSVQIHCMYSTAAVNPADNWRWSAGCAEVSIPSNIVPGTYHVGWEFCTDPAGTQGCQQLLYDIVIEAPPTMELTPPAPVALPSIYDTPTLCLSDTVAGTQQAGSNCSFVSLATTNYNNHGASFWCTHPENPDLTIELNSSGPLPIPHWLEMNISGGVEDYHTGSLGYYYDAPRTWYSAARWFNQPKWENCGRAVASRYSQVGPGVQGFPPDRSSRLGTGNSQDVLGSYQNYFNPGYYASVHSGVNDFFPHGILMGLSRWNGGKYSDVNTWTPNQWQPAMKNELSNQMKFEIWPQDGGNDISDGRVTGYPAQVVFSYASTGEPQTNTSGGVTTLTPFGANYQRYVTSLLSWVLTLGQPDGTQATTNRNWGHVGTQPYMATSSAGDAVVMYWERTHDPAMAKAMKYMLDTLATTYDWTQHTFPQMTAPQGMFCDGYSYTDPNLQWYAEDGAIMTQCMLPDYRDIVGLESWVYAWFWRNWGGDIYRQIADDTFTYSLIGSEGGSAGYRYKPKAYYQNNRHYYQYLHYRLGYSGY
jgi:hypothetical protein